MEQITYHDKFASSPFFGQVFVCVVCLPFCTLKGLIMKVLHSHTNLKIIENNFKNITNPIHGQSLSTFLCIISFDVLCILKNHYSMYISFFILLSGFSRISSNSLALHKALENIYAIVESYFIIRITTNSLSLH